MKIYKSITYQLTDDPMEYIVVASDSFEYTGSVALCKGASSQQNQIAGSQQAFMNTLQSDFGTAFQGQQSTLNSLNSSLSKTLAGGPSQFGYSPAETAALNTQATSGTAQQYKNAAQAAGEQASSVGGGNSVIPTSSAASTQAGIAQAGAQQTSNQLLGIQSAGWQQGNQNYNSAVSGLNQVASTENPNGLAGSANSAGSAAAGTAGTIAQMNNAASPWNEVGGILGGIASTAAGVGMKSLTGGALGGTPAIKSGGGGMTIADSPEYYAAN